MTIRGTRDASASKKMFTNKSMTTKKQLPPYILSGILPKDQNDLIKADVREYQGQYNTSVNIEKITLYYTILQQRQIKP